MPGSKRQTKRQPDLKQMNSFSDIFSNTILVSMLFLCYVSFSCTLDINTIYCINLTNSFKHYILFKKIYKHLSY